ncbi:hypothetical protein [Lactococcus sp. LG606]|uniref:hypothetical protein n=1 Tax=Lactococcus TaxID=1357 RepID=UPI001A9024CD|nr:hypothetical protein [Lactococcus sp. LG606]QSR13126.1 hypothetical protein J0J35_01725 [Lactococcus sp. LG606]
MINLSSLNSDEWATDEKLAKALGVKKETIQIKIRKFQKETIDKDYVIDLGKRITFVPAFIAWSNYSKKYRGVSRKPKFEYTGD